MNVAEMAAMFTTFVNYFELQSTVEPCWMGEQDLRCDVTAAIAVYQHNVNFVKFVLQILFYQISEHL